MARRLLGAIPLVESELAKLALMAHHMFVSPDLAARCILVLQARGALEPGTIDNLVRPSVKPPDVARRFRAFLTAT
ncbi:MAG: hypothetical protein HC863_01645 [Myxococcales bacterium]|nr:hypothetical protein [Myxococcales bacterium]